MNVSWLASVVFYAAFFVAWLTGELPRTLWVTVAAIAAIVIAVLLVIDNRGTFNHHP